MLTTILFQTIIITEIAQAQEEIKFVGTAIEYFKGGIGGRYGWYVRVDKVIFGPKLEGYIVEVYLRSVSPPWGYMDPDIKPGDTVETYGLYSYEDSKTYLISLLVSEEYYIKKMIFTKPVGGHMVASNKIFIILPYLTLAVLLAVTTVIIKREK